MANTGAVSRARVQRRRLTPPEARLWVCLRKGQLADYKFRRQHPEGHYVLDFYCRAAKLAVEVDGQQHGDQHQSEHDRRRTAWLGTQDIKVIRISAEDVRVRLDGVLTFIRQKVKERMGG